MKQLFDEFRAFIMKGNVVDLAVGVIIGAAFGTIVKAFGDGIINPLIGLLGGSSEVGLKIGDFDIGSVITAIIQFLITAAVLFFVFVKPMNVVRTRLVRAEEKAAEDAAAKSTEEVLLLQEIRDLLKNR